MSLDCRRSANSAMHFNFDSEHACFFIFFPFFLSKFISADFKPFGLSLPYEEMTRDLFFSGLCSLFDVTKNILYKFIVDFSINFKFVHFEQKFEPLDPVW